MDQMKSEVKRSASDTIHRDKMRAQANTSRFKGFANQVCRRKNSKRKSSILVVEFINPELAEASRVLRNNRAVR